MLYWLFFRLCKLVIRRCTKCGCLDMKLSTRIQLGEGERLSVRSPISKRLRVWIQRVMISKSRECQHCKTVRNLGFDTSPKDLLHLVTEKTRHPERFDSIEFKPDEALNNFVFGLRHDMYSQPKLKEGFTDTPPLLMPLIDYFLVSVPKKIKIQLKNLPEKIFKVYPRFLFKYVLMIYSLAVTKEDIAISEEDHREEQNLFDYR